MGHLESLGLTKQSGGQRGSVDPGLHAKTVVVGALVVTRTVSARRVVGRTVVGTGAHLGSLAKAGLSHENAVVVSGGK